MPPYPARTATLFVCCLLASAGSLRADEVRLVDGRVYCGKVSEEGNELLIVTRNGSVRVLRAEVQHVRDSATLERELGDLSVRYGDTAFAHLQLARLARDWALVDAMWVHADAAVTGGQASLQKPLREFLAGCEPELLTASIRRTPTENRVQELLWRVHREATPARIAAITEILALEPLAEAALRKKARQATLEVQRMTALAALGKRASQSDERFVWRTTLLDPAQRVREHAATLARDLGHGSAAVGYLASALDNEDATIRIRAAEAFAKIGNKSAIDHLVHAGPKAGDKGGGGTPHAHCAFLTQESYVRDFDVEVAQNAVIANPKVDTLQSGAVLDVAVLAVQVYQIEVLRAYRKSIVSLAGSDPGPDPAKWQLWREQILAKAKSSATLDPHTVPAKEGPSR